MAFRGEMALAQDRLDDAQRHFHAVLEQFPHGKLADDCRLSLSQTLQKQHLTAEARRLLSDLAASDSPKAAEAQFRLATLDYAAASYESAEQSFAKIVEQVKSGALVEKARLGRARALFHLRKFDDAAAALAPVTEDQTVGSEARYWLGLTRKAQGQWDAAAQLLAEAASASTMPERQTAALAELASCHAAAKEFDKARTAYAEFQDKAPGEELLRSTTELLAGAALAGGDAAWAAVLYTNLTDQGQPRPVVVRGLLGLARAYCACGEPAKADEALARIVQADATEDAAAEVALLRGQVLEQLGRSESALTSYTDAASKFAATSQGTEALARAARLSITLKRWDEAAAHYEQLFAIPDNGQPGDVVLYWWGWAALRAEHRETANNLFEQLRSEYPDSPLFADATCRLAQEALHAREYERAEKLLAELTDKSLNDDVQARAWYLAGQCAAAQEKWDSVGGPLEKVITTYPDSQLRPSAEFWLAEADFRQDRFDEAQRRFESLAKTADQLAPAWQATVALRQVQILAQQAQWTAALEEAQKLHEQYPDFAERYEADYVMGRAHAARAEFDEARTAYRCVLRSASGGKSETAAKAQWMIGESYMHQREYRTALREYLKVEILHKYPHWQAAALLQAGKCHELLEQPAEAAATYQRLLRNYPDTKYDEEAAQRLGQLRR